MTSQVPKRILTAVLLAILAAALSSGPAQAEPDVVMKPIPTVDVRPKIIGGREVDRSEYPANLVFTYDGALCTGTIVGPRVVLVAAHCIDDGGMALVDYGNLEVEVQCDHHTDYQRWRTFDIALCAAEADMRGHGIRYEHISIAPDVIDKHDILALGGFGCRTEGGRPSDKFVIGDARVTRMPRRINNYVETRGDAVCDGDSGGPAFKVRSSLRRYLVAVNSRGNRRPKSVLASLFLDKASAFVLGWKAGGNSRGLTVGICGLDYDQHCR